MLDPEWHCFPEDRILSESLSRELGVSPLMAQCLINRGMRKAEEIRLFLEPSYRHLADPFSLPDMDKAVGRIFQAREAGERIVLFGDYDADGITATAILLEVMEDLGWRVDKCLPHRHNEGVGLNPASVGRCLEECRPDLLLAVDCGSTATRTIADLAVKGVEVIVLDHHQLSDPLPPAFALVNPYRGEGSLRELSSAGLAFKLAHAIVQRARQLNSPPAAYAYDLKPLLDLVALGTVADMVPLVRENRVLVTAGLRRLNQTRRAGLLALMEVAQLRDAIDIVSINCQLGPRINAAGRMEDAMVSLDLLRSPDRDAAIDRARRMDGCNRERQAIEREVAEEAVRMAEESIREAGEGILVLGRPGWHIGVVGIVASRIVSQFYRPVLVLGGEGEVLKGSGRSVEGFDLARALGACGDLLLDHGGHAMAAGLTIESRNLDAFRQRLGRYARERLRPEHLVASLRLDSRIPLGENSLARMRELSSLEPYGKGNDPVRFCSRNLVLEDRPVRMGKEGIHARFRVTDGADSREVVWWNCRDAPLPSGSFDLAYEPRKCRLGGQEGIQLRLLHWRPAR